MCCCTNDQKCCTKKLSNIYKNFRERLFSNIYKQVKSFLLTTFRSKSKSKSFSVVIFSMIIKHPHFFFFRNRNRIFSLEMMQLFSHNLDSDSKNQDSNAQVFKRPFAIRSKYRLDIFTNIANYKKLFTIHKGAQFSTQRLALGNQRFLVRVTLVAMCRSVASAVIARLISKCRGSGWKWQRVEDICNFS